MRELPTPFLPPSGPTQWLFQGPPAESKLLCLLSRIEQAAAFLRAELAGGRWQGAMPGRLEWAADLGLNESNRTDK